VERLRLRAHSRDGLVGWGGGGDGGLSLVEGEDGDGQCWLNIMGEGRGWGFYV